MSIFCSLQKIRGCTAPYFFRNHDIITYLVIFSLPTDSYAHRQRRPTALLYSPRSARTAPPRSRAPSNKSNIVQTGNISTSQLKSLQPSYTTQMLKCQQQAPHILLLWLWHPTAWGGSSEETVDRSADSDYAARTGFCIAVSVPSTDSRDHNAYHRRFRDTRKKRAKEVTRPFLFQLKTLKTAKNQHKAQLLIRSHPRGRGFESLQVHQNNIIRTLYQLVMGSDLLF